VISSIVVAQESVMPIGDRDRIRHADRRIGESAPAKTIPIAEGVFRDTLAADHAVRLYKA
jgi:hypothetical protein